MKASGVSLGKGQAHLQGLRKGAQKGAIGSAYVNTFCVRKCQDTFCGTGSAVKGFKWRGKVNRRLSSSSFLIPPPLPSLLITKIVQPENSQTQTLMNMWRKAWANHTLLFLKGNSLMPLLVCTEWSRLAAPRHSCSAHGESLLLLPSWYRVSSLNPWYQSPQKAEASEKEEQGKERKCCEEKHFFWIPGDIYSPLKSLACNRKCVSSPVGWELNGI